MAMMHNRDKPARYQIISAEGLILITVHNRKTAQQMLRKNPGCTVRVVPLD